MMRLIIIQSAGDAKEEEVKKISHDLHLLEKRLKNKAGISGYAKWVDGCHSSAQCVPMKFIQNNVALTNKYDDDSGEKGERADDRDVPVTRKRYSNRSSCMALNPSGLRRSRRRTGMTPGKR